MTSLPHTIEYRHVFVMPTRFGFWFAVLLALMLVGGLNFNNNLTLMLGFMLASIALAADDRTDMVEQAMEHYWLPREAELG